MCAASSSCTYSPVCANAQHTNGCVAQRTRSMPPAAWHPVPLLRAGSLFQQPLQSRVHTQLLCVADCRNALLPLALHVYSHESLSALEIVSSLSYYSPIAA